MSDCWLLFSLFTFFSFLLLLLHWPSIEIFFPSLNLQGIHSLFVNIFPLNTYLKCPTSFFGPAVTYPLSR
ncbi:hypothetical protein M752DRAFT_159078 [Aspergillus phoenicis ATCC 13157]|uniref:Uncharacterized protein n=1 Tax=Aspergillus phoenicis ATCC 13157 TaxID=1353007 RepID=A0A370PN22_ASPPH|nr:hypothetical protein M752DRAFT_159078 [Aspergillus phoenicis ATCC 13157]